MAHKKLYWVCYAGERKKHSATILQQLTKEDTEQTCRENNTGKIYNDQITYTMLLIRQVPHTQTHIQTK